MYAVPQLLKDVAAAADLSLEPAMPFSREKMVMSLHAAIPALRRHDLLIRLSAELLTKLAC